MKSGKTQANRKLPVQLSREAFNELILEHLPLKTQKRRYKVERYKIFNYIMMVIYTGCQWKMLPIDKAGNGKPEVHYSQVFRVFKAWLDCGALLSIFEHSVLCLDKADLLDTTVLHGDGTTTMAKKGGDGLGFSGHKHMKGDKIVAFTDRNCNVISPMVVAPGNRHEGPLFAKAFEYLKTMCHKLGISIQKCIVSLDSAYDSFKNRKLIFNAGMTPNIKENKRNRKSIKRGRKRIFSEAIYQERFRTVERAFDWEDKFKRLLLRFERKSIHHFGMKLLAYTMINLRHFCG